MPMVRIAAFSMQRTMALAPSAGWRWLPLYNLSSSSSYLNRRLGVRNFNTFCALRSEEHGFFGRNWNSSLQTLKQLVGLFVETHEHKKLKIRTRYLELKVSASEEVVTFNSDLTFKKGMLVEIVKDGKIVCAVVDRPEGKKNWIAIDQHGNSHSVRPGKVRFVVPDVESFKPEDIVDFLKKAESVQDASLLEIAWQELFESEKTISLKKLANVLFGDSTFVEYYATHCMLSSKQVFFKRKQKGPVVFYEPRSSAEVQELQHQYNIEEDARKEFENFINSMKSAIAQPHGSKPPLNTWFKDKYTSSRVEALQSFALDAYADESIRNLAKEVLEALGEQKSPENALEVLIGIGILPVHVNVELLKSNIPVEFPEEVLQLAKMLEEEPSPDKHEEVRVDLTQMKVYTIDSDLTEEIDDGLSAMELPDGRIKVWIHIADPTRWIDPDHILEREAKHRGTTVYLPEKTIPMFPMNLAAGPMSLRQFSKCCALSVSVILNKDGSIAETCVNSSIIKPSTRLSYETASELIMLQLDEEPELNILAKAAKLRHEWRLAQGAIDTTNPIVEVKVKDPESAEPTIELHVVDMTSASGRMVSEMMILCGEAIAAYGDENMLALPYRGQSEMSTVEMNFTKALQHSSLGLPGYVQFTSPIRRYTDLLAHYQVKAALCKEAPPFSSGQLEAAVMLANLKTKEAKRLSNISTRYWLIEYLRRKPKDEVYEALVTRVKEGVVVICLKQVGLYTTVSTNVKLEVGDIVKVIVIAANPRKDIFDVELVEVVSTEEPLDNAITAGQYEAGTYMRGFKTTSGELVFRYR